MTSAGIRSTFRALAAFGIAALLVGAGLPNAARSADEKKDEKKDEKNPLREELLKLNSVTGEQAQKDKLVALIKDKDKAKKLAQEAGKMLKEAKGKENPFNYNGGLIVARLAHLTAQYEVAEPLYEYLIETATKLKSDTKLIPVYRGLVEMHYANKKYALAAELCEKFVAAKTDSEEYQRAKLLMTERWIYSLAKDEKYDDAQRLVSDFIEIKPLSWYGFQLKGWVLREQGKFAAAADAYNEAISALDANKELPQEEKDQEKDRTRYILTGVYVDNKEIDKAAKQLQTLVKRHPDNPTFKNDLGFIWCDNDMNLEESEKLIKEAIDLDKKAQEKLKKEGKIEEVKPNAAYLDSLGWVLFKQKKYKEALEPLKQAAADDEDGSHLEIWDHLGDCHLALGNKKEAIAAWKKGLKFEDLSKRDAERRRKVSEKVRKAEKTD